MKKRSRGNVLAVVEPLVHTGSPGARGRGDARPAPDPEALGGSEESGALRRELHAAREELALLADELTAAQAAADRTSEELRAANESLLTANAELRARNDEIVATNADLLNILTMVEVPIVIVDRERCVRRFTPNARPILNLLPSDVGRPIAELRPKLVVDALDQKVARVIETATVHEAEVRAVDARWYRLQIRPYVASDGAVEGALLSVVDVHALKEHLVAVEQAKGAAEEANRSKDQFLAVLSHELRTPLTSLLLQTQLLRAAPGNLERVQKASAAIERAAHAQARLIEDLLDVGRIVAGKLHVELHAVALAPLLRAAVESVEAAAAARRVRLDVTAAEPLAEVDGDAARLQQIVLNLLTNAIKFSAPGGSVEVTLDAREGQARVRVTDHGAGIAPEFLPDIFERFSQEQRGSERRHGGLGLGLAIVRALVDAHHGSITAESAGIGAGATFTVLLPLVSGARAEEPTAALATSAERDPIDVRGLRVMVVDDDEATRRALTETLATRGVEVRAAGSVGQALNAMEVFSPDVLVSDLAMPGATGYDLLARVRERGAARSGEVPALALTALASDEDRARARSAGFQAHLTKPIDAERLIAAIGALARARRAPA